MNVFDDGAAAGAGDALPGVRDGVEGDEVGAGAFAVCATGFAAGGGAVDGGLTGAGSRAAGVGAVGARLAPPIFRLIVGGGAGGPSGSAGRSNAG